MTLRREEDREAAQAIELENGRHSPIDAVIAARLSAIANGTVGEFVLVVQSR